MHSIAYEKSLHEKPSHEEWIHWSNVLVDRLVVCIRVYNIPMHGAPILAEPERQRRNARTTSYLHRLYRLLDEADTPTGSLADVAHHDEQVIDGLILLMGDIRDYLPELSADMQEILQSGWLDDFSSATALDLFKGNEEEGKEGLGSGHAYHGRLPGILAKLLEREEASGKRTPRKDLKRDVGERRHNHSWQAMRRWGDRNGPHAEQARQAE